MVKSSSLPPDCVTLRGLTVGDGHSTDTSSTSERLFGAPSEGNISYSCVKPQYSVYDWFVEGNNNILFTELKNWGVWGF
jgi:hypothetical protein